jgi:hypothetical protein
VVSRVFITEHLWNSTVDLRLLGLALVVSFFLLVGAYLNTKGWALQRSSDVLDSANLKKNLTS